MKSSIKYFFTLIFLVWTMFVDANTLLSSKPDTIFQYETLTVYDTVFVYDTIRAVEPEKLNPIEPKGADYSVLHLDTAGNKAILLIISGNKTATIPINGIILNENIKNLNSMKKLSFVGVVLFAFQSMVMAQTNYGITVGGGAWWAKCNEPITSVNYTPTLKAGVFFEHSLSNNVFLKTGLNYNYLTNNYSYKATVDTLNWVGVGDEASATAYHQFSIPLQFGYAIGKIKPYLGIEYSYRISESWLNQSINSFGLLGGINYAISDKVTLGINYYHGLTKDYEYSGPILNPVTSERMGEYNNHWKSSRLEFSLFYTFNKEKKME